MKKIVLLFIILITVTACTQTDNKTYYDADWIETTPENASYYRTQPKYVKELWRIHDYYITGEKQFIGQAKDSLATILEGDVTWYFKTGKVENKVRYNNGKQTGLYTVKSGSIGSEEEGWNEEDLIFHNQQTNVVDAAASTPSKETSSYEYYYSNTNKIASQHVSYYDEDIKQSYTYYFNRTGDTLARLDYKNASEKWEGREVIFYEEERRGKNDMTTIKTINTYQKGKIIQKEHYTIHEILLTQGTLQHNKPFNGTFYKEVCRFQKAQLYENGNLIQETTYNKDDKIIGVVSFKNSVPDSGIFYNCTSLQTYENGKLHGQSIQYFSDQTDSIEWEFTFKNGLRHGDFYIFQDESLLLEKGRYKNDVQIGEVLYYHNQIDYEEFNDNYYLKTNVKIKKNKPYISELLHFSIDDSELLNTFKFEANDSDKFTYINNGYHSIALKDLNSDGFNDLMVTYRHHIHDITTYTYYVFNSITKEYQHLPELDDANNVEINKEDDNIKAIYRKEFEGSETHISYEFLGNELIKKVVTEKVYHHEIDSTLVTQIFPIPINKYPLLDTTLPPIKFVQDNKNVTLITSHQKITLKKAPFSITFPGLIDVLPTDNFNVKITASYNIDVFQKALVDQTEGFTTIFAKSHTFAAGGNNPFFIIDENGHNILYYEDSENDTLTYIESINEDVKLFQFAIDNIHDGEKEKTISEINKPIYMIIYMDKNKNLKIDKNEIHYITLNFK